MQHTSMANPLPADGHHCRARRRVPSYAQGYCKRDSAFYEAWDEIARRRDGFTASMEANVMQQGPEAFARYARR
jgi:hypothetical protein